MHSAGAFGTIRCSRDLVIRRRRSRSQANILIFRGRRRFHTKRHLCKMSRSSEFFWSRSSLYATRVVKLGPLRTHASCAPQPPDPWIVRRDEERAYPVGHVRPIIIPESEGHPVSQLRLEEPLHLRETRSHARHKCGVVTPRSSPHLSIQRRSIPVT